MRSETRLTEIKGVGEKTAAVFEKIGVYTAGDLLNYFPRDYDYYTDPVTVDALEVGKMCSVTLTIIGKGSVVHAGRYRITTFHAADATGQIKLAYFNMPYLIKSIMPGSIHVFRGIVRQFKNGNLQMDQPQIFSPAEYDSLQSTFLPKYPLTQGLKNGQLIKMMEKVLPSYEFGEDYLTEKDREQLELMGEAEAARKIHFPKNKEDLIRSRNRMVFDEFVAFLLAVKKQKAAEIKMVNSRPMEKTPETDRFMASIPFELTDGQKEAWKSIEEDLTGNFVMNRLLQGDVGSGKTILAFLALLLCACNGRQGALMAPTEVLAQQHMKSLEEMIRDYDLPLKPVLLTGSVKGKARKAAYEAISTGEANVVIGTHALIQESVEYQDLGLVITDEQHRFGVRQRESLAGKGVEVPVLVMSATPIPRTLAIILYGDLQVSQLTELPKNRLPIKNLAMSMEEQGKAVRFVLNEIDKGRQAYIICPAVEESEMMEELENVKDFTDKLRSSIPDKYRVASLNGKMKPAEKNQVMEAFAAHETDILVSTTVIEVGINVPNSTVILIENAERFGLSQLHQLRGRVGRGGFQSYCIFLYSKTLDQKPKRLKILEKSNDGFYIAEQDLSLRGPGDMFGVRQSGEMGFHLADIYEDAGILNKASAFVDRALKEDPEFTMKGVKTVDFRSI